MFLVVYSSCNNPGVSLVKSGSTKPYQVNVTCLGGNTFPAEKEPSSREGAGACSLSGSLADWKPSAHTMESRRPLLQQSGSHREDTSTARTQRGSLSEESGGPGGPCGTGEGQRGKAGAGQQKSGGRSGQR